ncbi:hypothetical protein, partial [Caulobacter sp. 17J65-9]|uniref:hypothetical protein n=1 Tax=Caulobacter sp. 17J65-9 TaxID=2709382 RepID=UPI0013C65768
PQSAPQPTTPAAAPVTVAEAPARPDGPRRYSVHRAFGEAPDRPQLPSEFFLDGPPVDLADPPPQPLSERDERRLRTEAASPDTLSN